MVLNTNILLHNRCSNTFSHARKVGGEIVRLEIWQQFEKSSVESFLCPGIPFAIFGNSSQREKPREESDNQYAGQFTGRNSLFTGLRIQPTKFSFPTHQRLVYINIVILILIIECSIFLECCLLASRKAWTVQSFLLKVPNSPKIFLPRPCYLICNVYLHYSSDKLITFHFGFALLMHGPPLYSFIFSFFSVTSYEGRF